MTKDEAAHIRDAIVDIESGKITSAVRLLRSMLAWAGMKAPPPRVIEARQPREKKP